MTGEPHFHVFMGAAHAAPMATSQFEDYDESIRIFLRLTRGIYGGQEYFSEGLNYKNLLQLSEFGNGGKPMTIGTDMLCVQWLPCRNPCLSPSWN
jgi:hypothetical protein